MLPALPYHVVNAFAPTPHAGNQAAVLVIPADDPRASDEKWMQTVANDFNLAETAFLVLRGETDNVPLYGLRWFTPEEEVPLCGHATLAAAYTLFNYIHPAAKSLRFETRWRGELRATIEGEKGQGARVGLDLPTSPLTPAPEGWKAVVGAAAGLKEEDILQLVEFEFGRPSALVQIRPEVELKSLTVNTGHLLPTFDSVVIYTQLVPSRTSGDTVGVNARVFAPGVGIDEDPVTGSAWATMAGYYLSGPGTASVTETCGRMPAVMDAQQLSARGGSMSVRLVDGRAMLVGRGWRTAFGTLESFE